MNLAIFVFVLGSRVRSLRVPKSRWVHDGLLCRNSRGFPIGQANPSSTLGTQKGLANRHGSMWAVGRGFQGFCDP